MTQPSRKYVGGETIFYRAGNLPQLLVTTMISDLEIDLLVFILGFIHQRSTPRGVPMRLLRLDSLLAQDLGSVSKVTDAESTSV